MTLEDVCERPSKGLLQGRKLSMTARVPEPRHKPRPRLKKPCYTNVVLNRHTLLVSFFPKQRKLPKPKPLLRDSSIMVTSHEPYYVPRGTLQDPQAGAKHSIIGVALAKLRCPEFRCSSTRGSARRPLFRKSLDQACGEDEAVLVSRAFSIDYNNYSS